MRILLEYETFLLANNLPSIKMASSRFALLPIVKDDYNAITKLAIDFFTHNPFHHVTFPLCVPYDEISACRRASKIEYPQEGKEIQTLKIVDTATGKILVVAFAIWKLEPTEALREPQRPSGSDFRFIEDFRKRFAAMAEKLYDKKNHIGEYLLSSE
jgi:hypothetical protein